MNGILPGPLWLAVASAASTSSLENGNPTRPEKNATVSNETTSVGKHILAAEADGGRCGGEHPATPLEVEQQGC